MLFERADQALYKAKNNGRNKSVVSSGDQITASRDPKAKS
jgi:predicted signal transduction protein with EAL and GGDEF domain